MGMGTWPGPRGQRSVSIWLISLAALLALLPPTLHAFGQSCDGQLCCPIQDCMDLFHAAQDHLLGTQDSFVAPALHTLSSQQQHNHCVARRTIVECLRNITRQCKGDLQYHTAEKGMEKQMKQLNCSKHGPVFDPATYVDVTPVRPICTYQGETATVHKHCAMFGQPHLNTFLDQQQTCGILGAWPLVDNKYLTVQVTTEKLDTSQTSKNVTTSLTVMIKKEEKCGAHHFVMYQAQADFLPSTFDDGRSHFGRDRSVQLTEVQPKEHVEIYLRYIDTTLVVRRIANYLSFAIKMPSDIVQDNRTEDPDGIELCAKGCPKRERINQGDVLALASQNSHLKRTDSEVEMEAAVIVMSREKAKAWCKEAHVVDFYFDSCVYDLMSTGDREFSLAAYWAQQDAVRLHPQILAILENRTSLHKYDQQNPSGVGSLHRTSRHWHYSPTTWVLLVCQLVLCMKGRWLGAH